MGCCRNDMTMTSTRNNNVSLFYHFMDTFSGRVHGVDMKEQTQSSMKPNRVSLEDIDYGG